MSTLRQEVIDEIERLVQRNLIPKDIEDFVFKSYTRPTDPRNFMIKLRTLIFLLKLYANKTIIDKNEAKNIAKSFLPAGYAWGLGDDANFEDAWEGKITFVDHILKDPELCFKHYLQSHGYTYQRKTQMFYATNLKEKDKLLQEKLRSFVSTMDDYKLWQNETFGKIIFNETLLEAGIRKYMDKINIEAVEKIKEKIKHDKDRVKENKKHFDNYILALYGKEEFQFASLGLYKFLHQVKTKLFYTVERCINHVFIFNYGTQGCGKSFASNMLFEVLEDLYNGNANPLAYINDDRYYRVFFENFVQAFDEGEKLVGADMANFKNAVSNPMTKGRILGTNSFETLPNNSSFIANSNKPVQVSIIDPTGNRRIVALNIAQRYVKGHTIIEDSKVTQEMIDNHEVEKKCWVDRDLLLQVDPIKVWQYVNEDEEKTEWDLPENHAYIVGVQKTYCNIDSVQDFIETCCVISKDDETYTGAQELYNAYKNFCHNSGFKAQNAQNFKLRLNELTKIEQKKSNKGRMWKIGLINPSEIETIEIEEMKNKTKEAVNTPKKEVVIKQ